MIDLLTADTPNGKKISIMLEEINYEYKVTKININKDEQFKKAVNFEKNRQLTVYSTLQYKRVYNRSIINEF